MLYLKL